MQRWWVRKYQLPPNHALFLERNVSDLTLEMYEDMLVRRDELLEQSKAMKEHSDRQEMLNRANAIGELFGLNTAVEDDLVAKWEREFEAGEDPDLDEEQPVR